MVPEKNVTEIFCDADDDDDKSDPYMSPLLKRAGDTMILLLFTLKIILMMSKIKVVTVF